MPEYNKQTIWKQAKELGFVRDTLEKMFRLAEILKFLNSNSLLKDNLALKGGTAINLTILNLPRLSVDIDLDYIQNTSREEMLDKRYHISAAIVKYMAANGYDLSPKSKTPHSLVFAYTNSAGIKDNIKIEINYSLRSHILPCQNRKIEALGLFDNVTINSLDSKEIFASKIVAMLTRAAARDLYDINNMICFGLFDESELPLLKKCAVFYSAIAGEKVPSSFAFEKIDTITSYKIKTDLLPVIRNSDSFDLSSAQKRVKDYLRDLLELDDGEKQFLKAFENKEYHPEYLFDDSEILSRIQNHPMALWKMRSVKEQER